MLIPCPLAIAFFSAMIFFARSIASFRLCPGAAHTIAGDGDRFGGVRWLRAFGARDATHEKKREDHALHGAVSMTTAAWALSSSARSCLSIRRARGRR